MIQLKKMKIEEFPRYREIFIKDYGAELAENYKYPLAQAFERAEKEIDADLPEGPLTKDNALMTIVLTKQHESQVVGYLWYVNHKDGDSAFIYDFYIFADYRSHGYGKKALEQLEKLSLKVGVQQIKLRVAYYNPRALKLYQKLGFEITGLNMMKALKQP